MGVAFTFPGQGSQAVGMGQALAQHYAVARQVFEEVDEALGQKLSTMIFEGPDDQLTLTANAQPALMAVSMASIRCSFVVTLLSLSRLPGERPSGAVRMCSPASCTPSGA